MLYYKKYLKYKNKYLKYKNLLGGGPPLNNIIKNIGLFQKNSDIDNFLNPIYGFIYYQTDFIKNNYNFCDNTKKNNICWFIKQLFHKLSENEPIQPTSLILRNIKPKDIGIILGSLYFYKIYKSELNIKLNEYNKIKSSEIKNGKAIDHADIIKLNDNIKKINLNISKLISDYNTFIENYIIEKNYVKQDIKEKINIICNTIKIENNINNEQFFRTILAILWYISNDKNNIRQYYEGINESFCYFNEIFDKRIDTIIISDEYVVQNFLANEPLENITFEKALFLTSKSLMNLTLYNQHYSYYKGNRFPDCGESIIRSFINIICFNHLKNIFDTEILSSYGADCKVLEYYEVFNNFEKQTSEKKLKIFGINMDARDAWNEVVSNLPDVCYAENRNGFSYNICALNSNPQNRTLNFLLILKKLFKRIESFNDFGLGPNGITVINQDSIVYININHIHNGNYQIIINLRPMQHYSISSKNNQKLNFDYTNLNREEQRIIDILLNKDKIYENLNDNFYFIKWEKEKLFIEFNNLLLDECIDNKLYTIIFNYLYNKYKDAPDERKRILLDLSKIENLKIYELNNFGYEIKYDKSNNIIKLTFGKDFNKLLNKSLKKLTTLQELTFGENFNQSLGDSLNTLINLKKLTFGENFNQSLGDSLKKLTTLQELTFGENFNQPLDKSLKKLITLQKLTFGYNFNQSLDDSLQTLTNLKELNLSEYFNNFKQPTDKIFINLINLEKLNFSIKEKKRERNSFDYPLNRPRIFYAFDLNQYNDLHPYFKQNILQPIISLQPKLQPFKQIQISLPKQSKNIRANIRQKSLSPSQTLSFKPQSKLDNELVLDSSEFIRYLNGEEIIYIFTDNPFVKLSKLKELVLPKYFNKSLDKILDRLTSLEKLTFGIYFNNENKPLGESLKNLNNLKQLTFGNNFNQPLNESLKTLTSLQQLTFDNNFNNGDQPLNESLKKLTSLQQLTFGKDFNNGDQPLNESLKTLIRLQQLTFDNNFNNGYNPLDNSLKTLTSLQKLTFGYKFSNANQPLGEALKTLTSLQELTFGVNTYFEGCLFNQPLGDSLITLTSLQKLIFGMEFNNGGQPLRNSLRTLINLKYLYFGSRFNQDLNESLSMLSSLQQLIISYSSYQKLSEPLKCIARNY